VVRDGSIVDRLTETFTSRHNTTPGRVRAPIYNPVYTAAFMTDPYSAVHKDGKWRMPDVPEAQLLAVLALVCRVGGPSAQCSFKSMVLSGYPSSMQTWVEAVAAPQQPVTNADDATQTPERVEMPSMESRRDVWGRFEGAHPELQAAVLGLMACHATACATELNRSLWGWVYSCARNALGAERAKKLITICTNSGGSSVESDFVVTLKVVEGDCYVVGLLGSTCVDSRGRQANFSMCTCKHFCQGFLF
jgi:hypothetical protein